LLTSHPKTTFAASFCNCQAKDEVIQSLLSSKFVPEFSPPAEQMGANSVPVTIARRPKPKEINCQIVKERPCLQV